MDEFCSSNPAARSGRFEVQDLSLPEPYSKWNYVVKKKTPNGVESTRRSELAQAVVALRTSMGWSQAKLAEALGTIQGQVAKWETDALKPSGQMLLAMSNVASESEKPFWLKQAGVQDRYISPEELRQRKIPLLHDSLAAGTPRAVDENEVEQILSIPADWLPRGGQVFAVRVKGDSMAPIINDGYTVMIDVSQRDPRTLNGKMVAARDQDGVTVKWLRSDGDTFLLVPQHTSLAHPVRILRFNEGWGIVGAVVKWIGEPPSLPKRK